MFGDLHAPYHHKDALKFLAAVKEKYQPTAVFSMGDELDNHAMSFWPTDITLANATDELKMGRAVMKQVAALFPTLRCVDSNHTSRLYRAGKQAGIPKELLVAYDVALGVQDYNWTWEREIRFKRKGHYTVLIHNGGTNILNTSRRHGCSVVAAHHHTFQSLSYWTAPNGKRAYAIQLGSLINHKSPAFNYSVGQVAKPLLGCAVIINGKPKLIEMNLRPSGRWDKTIN